MSSVVTSVTTRDGRLGMSLAGGFGVLGVVLAVGVGLVYGFAPDEWRAGLFVGLGCGAFGGAAGLGMLAMTLRGGPMDALGAKLFAFLLRILLVAGGLLVTIRGLDADPVAFVSAFFPLFFVSSLLEHLVASGAGRPRA